MFEILEGDVTKTSASHLVFVEQEAIRNTAARSGVHCGVVCAERKLLALHSELLKNLNFVLKYVRLCSSAIFKHSRDPDTKHF